MSTTVFVIQLPREVQEEIRKMVWSALWDDGYRGDELESLVDNAVCDRLCNLSEIVNIEELNNKYNLSLELQFIICIEVRYFCVLNDKKVTILDSSYNFIHITKLKNIFSILLLF